MDLVGFAVLKAYSNDFQPDCCLQRMLSNTYNNLVIISLLMGTELLALHWLLLLRVYQGKCIRMVCGTTNAGFGKNSFLQNGDFTVEVITLVLTFSILRIQCKNKQTNNCFIPSHFETSLLVHIIIWTQCAVLCESFRCLCKNLHIWALSVFLLS